MSWGHVHSGNDFDGWNSLKKRIDGSEFVDFVHSREVWRASVGINIGFEKNGKNALYERPVLILKKFSRLYKFDDPIFGGIRDSVLAMLAVD